MVIILGRTIEPPRQEVIICFLVRKYTCHALLGAVGQREIRILQMDLNY